MINDDEIMINNNIPNCLGLIRRHFSAFSTYFLPLNNDNDIIIIIKFVVEI